MRIYLKLSPNTEVVPFNYQQSLVGAFHKWLGPNELHDDVSLYSLSWLSQAKPIRGGFDFPNGSTFFISSPLKDLPTKMVAGVFNNQLIRWGMKVQEVKMQVTPNFGTAQRFLVQSPVLIKRKSEGSKHSQYYYHDHTKSNEYLTETLRMKLQKLNLSTDVSVGFDSNYRHPKIKKIIFNKIDIKASLCPVIVKGNARAVQFAWEVGVGNSTGIGFGALC